MAASDYFTLADLRELPDLADATLYPDDRLEAARGWIVGIVERECQTSFVPVAKTLTRDGDGGRSILLPDRWVVDLTSVTVDGVTQTGNAEVDPAGEVTLYLADGSGYGAFTRGFRNVVIAWRAGWSSTPPDDLKQVMLQAARYRVVQVDGSSGIPNRATAITNEFGNVTLATAGEHAPTGIPDVDAVILGYAEQTATGGWA